jgi:hypothetical protein
MLEQQNGYTRLVTDHVLLFKQPSHIRAPGYDKRNRVDKRSMFSRHSSIKASIPREYAVSRENHAAVIVTQTCNVHL